VAGSSQPVRIDASLLSRYIEALGVIGWQADGGIIRPVYSPAWVRAREQLTAEYTSPQDAALGATVLATALYRLAY